MVSGATPEYAEAIEKFASAEKYYGAEQCARALNAIDVHYGQAKYVMAGSGIPDPWTSVYWNPPAGIEKEATPRQERQQKALEKIASQSGGAISPEVRQAVAKYGIGTLGPIAQAAVAST